MRKRDFVYVDSLPDFWESIRVTEQGFIADHGLPRMRNKLAAKMNSEIQNRARLNCFPASTLRTKVTNREIIESCAFPQSAWYPPT